jgi:hypothetical protein
MTSTSFLSRSSRWAMFPAFVATVAFTGVADAAPQAAASTAASSDPVRLVRVNGSLGLTVAAPHGTVGLRASFPAPTDGTTEAEVRVARNGVVTHNTKVKLVISGTTASFKMPVKAEISGEYRVGVRVDGALVGDPVNFTAIPRRVTSGSGKSSIELMQSLLSDHAYVVGNKGSFDARTGRALIAIRKRLGLSRTPTYDSALANALAKGEGDFHVRFPGQGRHVEANLSQQLLALIGADGKVQRVYTTSSGKPSTPTVLGTYSVYRKDLGTNSEGMVDSSYFIRGYAIHGYAEVPTYNASHGCLRVPIPDALSIFKWVQYGTKVDVYR